MGFNPNELFSEFKGKMMDMVGAKKQESSGIKSDYVNGKPFSMYPADILTPTSEVTKAIQLNAIKYSWKKKDASAKSKGYEGGGNIDEEQHVWSCFLPIPSITTSDGHAYSEFNGWGLGEAVSQLPSALRDVGKAVTDPSAGSELCFKCCRANSCKKSV